MREGQKRVNVYIPDDLYSRVLNSEYNITEAIITGLTKLLEPAREDFDSKIDASTKEDSNTLNSELVKLQERTEEQNTRIEEYKVQVQSLNSEIKRLKTALMETPDPLELVKLQERNEGLNLLLAEREKRIEEIVEHKENMSRFADYFRSTEPKLIEAPAAERKKPWYKFW